MRWQREPINLDRALDMADNLAESIHALNGTTILEDGDWKAQERLNRQELQRLADMATAIHVAIRSEYWRQLGAPIEVAS